MSGGIAYVLDADGRLRARAAITRWSISSRSIDDDDIELVRDLIERHVAYTGSTRRRAAARRLGVDASSGSSR